LLAARAEGIGVGWVSIIRAEDLREIFGLPPTIEPIAYLCLGRVEEFHATPDLQRLGWLDRIDLAPLVFEDKTGQYSTTDLDDIYDRMFFRVVQHSVSPSQTVILVYDRARRSNRRNSGPETIPPSVVLDFSPKSSGLGSVTFERMPPIPIKEFLKKMGTFGSSLNRRFVASDSNEYRWTRKAIPGQEWTCFNAYNQIVAHYDLKDPEETSFRTSGNSLIVDESLLPISAQLLATLIIMRHIEHHRL